MANLEELKLQIQPYKNTLVIDELNKVVKLVDVIEDQDDYYWVYDDNNYLYYSSCAFSWVPLKGFIEQEKYERLVNIWNLNNTEKAI